MAVRVVHKFVSAVPNGWAPGANDIVMPYDWNDEHEIEGLGTAAEANTGDFATAAQGALADSAVQPADIANMLETADIGVTVQGYDADLAAWAGVNPSSYSDTAAIAAAYQPLDSDLTAIAALTTTAYGRALLALASSTALQLYIGVRELLTANRTYYVRGDGSDSNDGRTDTAGGAFLTLNAAYAVIKSTLDLGGYTVTIQLDGTTFTNGLAVSGWVGGGNIVLDGGNGTISRTNAACINVTALDGNFTYQNITLTTTTGGNCVSHSAVGRVIQGAGVVFGACAGNGHIVLGVPGAYHQNTAAYSITGGAARHMWATCTGAYIYSFNSTITITGTPAFTYFANSTGGSTIYRYGTISGSATGTRFLVDANGVINTAGSGASYLPGDVAGIEQTDGHYI